MGSSQRTFRLDRGAAVYLAGDASLTGRSLRSNAATMRVHPDDQDFLESESVRAAEVGSFHLVEFRVLHPILGQRWVMSRGRTTRDRLGRPTLTRGVLIDITDIHIKSLEVEEHDDTAEILKSATDHVIAARRALEDLPVDRLRTALDIVLLEIGDLIAEQSDPSMLELHH